MSENEGNAGSWYDSGYGGAKREEDRIAAMSGPRRLWMPKETSKRIVFVDDDPICFPAGTMVSTEGGAKPIEDVVVGDKVRAADGSVTSVTKVLPTLYQGKMVRLEAQGLGEGVLCTEDHPFAVVRGMECRYKDLKGGRRWCTDTCTLDGCPTQHFTDYKPEWVSAKDVKVGDFLLMPTWKQSGIRQEFPLKYTGTCSVPMERFLGLFVAEGSARVSRGEITLTFHEDEKNLHEEAKAALEALGCKTVSIVPSKLSRATQVHGYSKELAATLGKLCGIGAENKHLPYAVFTQNRETLVSCLSGYLEGDGWLGMSGGSPKASAVTVSKELAYQLRVAIQLLGGKPNLQVQAAKTDRDGVNHRESFILNWVPRGIDFAENGWLPSGAGRMHRQDVVDHEHTENEAIAGNFMWLPVTSVDAFEETLPVYNLTCGPNNTFIANGVGVHNCVYEHNPKLNGTFRNWFTCLRGLHPSDAICCEKLGENTRYYCGYFTIVDCSEWTDKKGNKYQYELKLLQAKLKTLKKLKLKKEGRGSLAGCMYTAMRSDEKSPVCGDDFEFVKEVDMEKLFGLANYHNKKLVELFEKASGKDNVDRLAKLFQVVRAGESVEKRLVPFNYMELLKPRSPASVQEMLTGSKVESGGGEDAHDTPEGAAEEDIPF